MSDKEANQGSWDSDFPKDDKNKGGDNNNRIPFMKFDGPGDYTIRLVGNHVKFRRHWQPFTGRIITHDDYKNEDPAWQAGFYPREAFAIHVIDRADGQLKILEKGRSLFKQFARYKAVNDVNPAGNEGTDWVITVEWPGGNKRQAKYSATAKTAPSPFTDSEKEMIKESKAPLKVIYSSTPLDKIKEAWDALPDEAKVAPKKEDNQGYNQGRNQSASANSSRREEASIEEDMDGAPADSEDDDLFGDETEF